LESKAFFGVEEYESMLLNSGFKINRVELIQKTALVKNWGQQNNVQNSGLPQMREQ